MTTAIATSEAPPDHLAAPQHAIARAALRDYALQLWAYDCR
jgi:hypothetical protein